MKPYITARALPRWSGRCDAAVTKRGWDGALEQRTCSRQAVYLARGGGKFCIQHHPDEDGARREDERLDAKANLAFDLYDEMLDALREIASTRRSEAWGRAVDRAKAIVAKAEGR